MKTRFDAALVARTATTDTGSLEVTLADKRGESFTIAIDGTVAASLAKLLEDHAARQRAGTGLATKRPKRFAVGSGRHESVVLVRFEDDIPYGLNADAAAELGRALLEESDVISELPARPVQ